MKNSTFYARFMDESNCVDFIYSFYKNKINSCPKCKSTKLKWSGKNKSWRCNKCTRKISLKSVSFMRDSNKPFRVWMEVLFLQLNPKKALSIKEIMAVTGERKYETVYHMVRKIDNELGRINQQMAKTFETIFSFEEEKELPPNFPTHLRMSFTTSPNRRRDLIRFIVTKHELRNIEKEKKDRLDTEQYPFPKLFSQHPDLGKTEGQRKFKEISIHWKKILKENLLRIVDGIYHEISLLHLQSVLDDYCFKYNFRHSEKPKIYSFFEELTRNIGKIPDTQ